MSWNEDVAYAFTPYKVLTLPLGIWPLQEYNTFALVRWIVCGICLSASMIMLFLEIVFSSDEVYVKLDALVFLFCNIISVLKLLFFRLYADNLTRNFSSAVNDYFAIDTEEERMIMRRHAYMGKMICFIIVSFGYVASSMSILTPLLASVEDIQLNASIENQASKLPLPLTWTLGDFHMSTNVFLLICMGQYFLFVLNCICDCGGDSLYLAIVLHVCGQIELLKIEFANYGMKDKNTSAEFSKLACRHYYLIKHAKLLGDVTSFLWLVSMLCCYLLICLIGFVLILAFKTNDIVMITKCITVFITMLFQCFFYCFVGDYLKCQTEEIAHSIYSCNWHYLPMNLMTNILFAIMRSQQPVQFLAGGIFVVNIKTYMALIKSSLSYFSVLRVMVDED
ncbi:PREDICTED: odorant receptor 13a-like [Vollenhovia emeryi]|uniref:odorant receptor 13a-like n=1 Tax=Vollenhovia emeryi TaxID=411798 RepID=UPI0005F3F5E8|nr:PREDICTED: odorant receptor 13a-like [Vollenhovia emeryi]